MDAVYNAIAHDFSRTRYKVWSRVAAFLDSLKPQDSLFEVGCGNGKNLLHRKDLIVSKGVDISEDLLAICRERGLSVEYGDARNIPEPDNSYNAVLAIAVIHHLPTRQERQQALREIIRIMKPGAQALISVWAWSQPLGERRQFPTQDEMVPFHTSTGIVYRYYHLYAPLELQEDLEVVRDSLTNLKMGWYIINEKGNYYAKVWICGPIQACNPSIQHR